METGIKAINKDNAVATSLQYLFLLVYVGYLTALILQITVLGGNDTALDVLQVLRYASYTVVVIKICIDQFQGRQIVVWMLLILLVLLSVYSSSSRELAFGFLFLLGARNVDPQKIIRWTVLVQAVILVLVIALSQTGVLLDYVTYADTRSRHCLGFSWANVAPYLFLFFMLGYLYLRKERVRIYEVSIFVAVSYIFYVLTDTRWAFFLGVAVPLLFWLLKFFGQNRANRSVWNKWLIPFPGIVCVATILLHYFYQPENEKWLTLNRLFSGRLAYGKNALDTYGIPLFGTEVQWIGNGINGTYFGEYNFVDSSYVRVLIDFGVVILFVIMALYTLIMYRAVKEKNCYLQLAIFFVMIVCITEPFLFRFAYNAFLFLAMEKLSVSKTQGISVRLLWGQKKVRFRGVKIALKDRK